MSWIEVGELSEIPRLGSRVVRLPGGDVAVFRTGDDRVFALRDACPHRGGPLSQGIVHGHRVTCPLHNWVIELESGEAAGPDTGCTAGYAVKVQQGRVWLSVEPARDSQSGEACLQRVASA